MRHGDTITVVSFEAEPKRMRATTTIVFAVVLALLMPGAPARGHDGPREQIAVLTQQLTREPSRADLYLRRGNLQREAGDLTAARTDLARALSLDGTLPGLPLAWARLQFDERRFADAVTSATQALTSQPGNVAALRLRADAHTQLHQRARAVADLTRIIELAPTPDTVIERARLLAADPTTLDEALTGIVDGLRRIGPVVTLQLEAIDLERRLRRYDAALRRLDSITAQATRKEQWLARRGALLEEAHRTDEAMSAYRLALDAINALPPHARTTRATDALVSDLHHRIDRLTAGTTRPSAGRSPSR